MIARYQMASVKVWRGCFTHLNYISSSTLDTCLNLVPITRLTFFRSLIAPIKICCTMKSNNLSCSLAKLTLEKAPTWGCASSTWFLWAREMLGWQSERTMHCKRSRLWLMLELRLIMILPDASFSCKWLLDRLVNWVAWFSGFIYWRRFEFHQLTCELNICWTFLISKI